MKKLTLESVTADKTARAQSILDSDANINSETIEHLIKLQTDKSTKLLTQQLKKVQNELSQLKVQERSQGRAKKNQSRLTNSNDPKTMSLKEREQLKKKKAKEKVKTNPKASSLRNRRGKGKGKGSGKVVAFANAKDAEPRRNVSKSG